MAHWFYIKEAQQVGPLSELQILQAVEAGDISEDTLMWTDQLEDWTPYSVVKDRIVSSPQAPSANTVSCPYCHSQVSQDDLVQAGNSQICVNCKDQYLQMIKEGIDPHAPDRHYAGFWLRFCAYFLDGLILNLFFMPMTWLITLNISSHSAHMMILITNGMTFLRFAITLAYFTFFIGNPKFQATPGKMALKLKVIRSDGSAPSYGLAAGRYLAYIIDTLILFIGFLMCIWDSEKRCLHDRICNTRVIRKS